MKIQPVADMVLLSPVPEEQTTKGGIIIPDTAKEKPMMATVLAVGPGGMLDGKDIEMYIKEGQKVIYRRYAGTDLKLEGEEYVLCRQSEIMAIVQD